MNEKQKELVKNLEQFRYVSSVREVFCDSVANEALRIALLCDSNNQKLRKQKQEELLKRYQGTDRTKFENVCNIIRNIMLDVVDSFEDYLGEIYMELGLANKQNQQFFTPTSVGRLMAGIQLSSLDFNKPVTSINDPCCGSGSLLLSVLNELTDRKINYADKVLIVANDIDKNCVNMCYLQLAWAGVPAVVLHQNTITQEVIGETFITPAFALQFTKFKKVYEDL